MIFEFGRRRRKKDGSHSGTFTLWIYMAEWNIRNGSRELAHSESSDKLIHRAAETLTGKKLEAAFLKTCVAKSQVRFGASFCFEGGYKLHAWAYKHGEDDEDIFFLYSPTAFVSYSRDGVLVSKPNKRQ